MERILLWERDIPQFDEKIGQAAPSLTPFLLDDGKKHGAVIVFPGGGYTMKAAHEGAPVAERLNEMGLHAFVLDYRVAPYRFPVPLLDAQRAIRLLLLARLRNNAAEILLGHGNRAVDQIADIMQMRGDLHQFDLPCGIIQRP